LLESGVLLEIAVATDRKQIGLVGAVGIEFASLFSKSNKGNSVAPPPHFQLVLFGAWCLGVRDEFSDGEFP
jgi:hypothetical protein